MARAPHTDDGGRRRSDDRDRLNVLQLVTTRRPFFAQQIDVLERTGVDCDVLEVPRSGGSRSPAAYLQLYAETLRAAPWEYDLVHANYGLTAPAALAQPGRPVVLSLWGSDVFGRFGGLSRQCARLADDVIVMSHEMVAAVGCACHVIPHGVDLWRFQPTATARAQAAVGWDPDTTHVLFPYDPDRPEKDHPRAKRVVEAVDERLDRPVSLEVVHGVAHDTVPTYMNAADALLLTSTHEGSPNTVKEALACNTPVVTLDVGDVQSLLADVWPSAVCADDDALVAALTETLGTDERPDGRAAVEPLSLARMGKRLRGVYDAAIARRA